MSEFTTDSPLSIPITVSSFLRMFGAGGVTPAAVFSGEVYAQHSFGVQFPGVLTHSQASPDVSLVADIGLIPVPLTGVPAGQWAALGVIPQGASINIRAASGFIGDPVSDLANFVASAGSIPLAVSSFSSQAPASIAIPSASFTPNPPLGGLAYAIVPGAILTEEGSMITDESGSILIAD